MLLYGETRNVYKKNVGNRHFKLGPDVVCEKSSYDHVGVKNCIFDDDCHSVEEKISKGRKTLNASTGLGIRKNGINMMTGNIIFWSVVVPTVTFGSEIWVLSDTDVENLLNFQRFAGRRIQRFPPRSPNSSSFYGLGWAKLSTYIGVKKLLFAMSIIRMEIDHVLRVIFKKRLEVYLSDKTAGKANRWKSPLFEIFNTSDRFGLLDSLCNMINGDLNVYGKKRWSELVWKQAWAIEYAYWRATNLMCKYNDLVTMTTPNTMYLSWWRLSDSNHKMMRISEMMAKIVCRTSRLKCDDVRLKGAPASQKTCERCDH